MSEILDPVPNEESASGNLAKSSMQTKYLFPLLALLVAVGLLVMNLNLQNRINDLEAAKEPAVGATASLSLFDEPTDLQAFVTDISESIVTIRCDGGVGTGFSYAVNGLEDGYKSFIVTNHHVIDDCVADESLLKVYYGGEKQIATQSKIYGWDEENDLALLEIKAELPPLEEADNFSKSGEWTMAIGNPVDEGEILYGATTFGRTIYVLDEYFNYTSAVINRGNSGGPLVNSQGKLIGINSLGSINDEQGLWNIAIDSFALCKKIIECE